MKRKVKFVRVKQAHGVKRVCRTGLFVSPKVKGKGCKG